MKSNNERPLAGWQRLGDHDIRSDAVFVNLLIDGLYYVEFRKFATRLHNLYPHHCKMLGVNNRIRIPHPPELFVPSYLRRQTALKTGFRLTGGTVQARPNPTTTTHIFEL
jgi:hypothetical protein